MQTNRDGKLPETLLSGRIPNLQLDDLTIHFANARAKLNPNRVWLWNHQLNSCSKIQSPIARSCKSRTFAMAYARCRRFVTCERTDTEHSHRKLNLYENNIMVSAKLPRRCNKVQQFICVGAHLIFLEAFFSELMQQARLANTHVPCKNRVSSLGYHEGRALRNTANNRPEPPRGDQRTQAQVGRGNLSASVSRL